MRIVIDSVPIEHMRYSTLGDYWEEGDTLFIEVADYGDDDFSFLVAVHELVEAYLTKKRGIREEDITSFDMSVPEDDEPGDNPQAPYQNEHNFATGIERLMCAVLGRTWSDYTEASNKQLDIYGKSHPLRESRS